MWMRAYAVVSSVALVILSTAAFRQAAKPQTLGEITVERINVVDANGTLRMVISNKDRMHPGVLDGKTLNRPRPEAGLIFFNDEGDEDGGLTYRGQAKGGSRRASSGLNLDQLKGDQTIGMGYREVDGQRLAAFQVWDPSDVSLGAAIDKINAANATTDPVRREALLREAEAVAPPRPRRIFVGKTEDHSASVALSDGQGNPRLKLTVDANGNPRIEFLDDKGQVTQRLPQR
jgi:hypothetical protein